MKKLVIFILGFSLIYSVNATETDRVKNVKGSGNVVSKMRRVDTFNKLDIGGVFNIYLTQGDAESLRIEIDDNLHQYVLTKVENGVLKIKIKDNINFRNPSASNIYITLKDINEIDINGVCDVFGNGVIHSDDLKIIAKGVSDVKLELTCNNLDINSSGVGDCVFSGNVGVLNINSSGTRDINAKKLVAQKANVIKSGVGDVKVNVVSEISINSSGVGKVIYYGDPIVKGLKKTGLGEIVKR